MKDSSIAVRTKMKHPLKGKFVALAALLAAGTGTALARGEVDTVITEAVPATPSSYIADGKTYRWGLGVDLKIRSFVYQGKTLGYNPITPDRVQILRIDNPNANGKPCAIYAERAGDTHGYQPTLPATSGECPMGAIIAGDTVNIGALDVFSNAGIGDYSLKNIERVDLIYTTGIIAPDDNLNLAGHPVLEKSGNNPIKIAAILSLDSNGQPASYGPLVTVHRAAYADSDAVQYGITNVNTINDFLWSNDKQPNGPMIARSTLAEPLGFAFVTLTDLGIAPGQTYYGVSAFGIDVDAGIHDLNNPNSFPLDTGIDSIGDDADLHIGSAGNLRLKAPNLPPQAQPDTATTKSGEPVSIDVKANDSDPENDPLTLTIVTPPGHGNAVIENGLIVYVSESGFSGEDFLIYRIDDGHGGSSEARVTISVEAKPTAVLADPPGTRRIIETGLQGHGAGTLGWLLAPLAVAARRRAKRIGASR